MRPTIVSWAQNGEDIVLRRALRDVAIGVYIDVGAADPDRDSVTKLFYDMGWHGILRVTEHPNIWLTLSLRWILFQP